MKKADTKERNNNKKRFPLAAVLLIVIACGVFAFSAYKLIDYYRVDEQSEQQAQELFELAVTTVPPSAVETLTPTEQAEVDTPSPTEYAADTDAPEVTYTPGADDTEAAVTETSQTEASHTQTSQATAQPTPQSGSTQTPAGTETDGTEAAQTDEPQITEQPAPTQSYDPPTTGPLYVDFDALHEINPDICGWIYSQGTPINYPVVLAPDGTYYLTHLVDGTYSKAGSIFVDYRNSRDFSDIHTIVYGHNMKSGTMFGSLKGYKLASYYNAHQYMWLYTPEAVFRLDVVAAYVSHRGGAAYQFYYDVPSMQSYLTQAKAKSAFNAPIAVTDVERIITLSTCTYEFLNARFVVICRPVQVG